MKVAIVGAGGLARVIAEAIDSRGEHEVAGFLDDRARGRFCGAPVLGKLAALRGLKARGIGGVALALGDGFLELRLRLIAAIRATGLAPIKVIHPTAWVSPTAQVGAGSYVGPLSVIHTGARIGAFCVIWSGCVVEHDNRVGENAFLAPGVTTAGYAEIGRDAFLGTGATVLRCRVGRMATVGAASLVRTGVAPRSIVMGVPARVVGRKTANVYHD